jgi:SAM-dependent methyltransferase
MVRLVPALLLLALGCSEAPPPQAPPLQAPPPPPAPSARPEPPPRPAAVGDDGEQHSEDPFETVRREIDRGEIPRSLPGILDPADQATLERRIRDRVAAGEPLSGLYRPAVTSPAFISTLGIGPDEVVADIGAGTGGLELALLELGLSFGTIHAVDVGTEGLDLLRFQLETAALPGRERVEIDVRLPAASIDRALVINVSSFNAEQDEQGLRVDPRAEACLRTLAAALKPGGELLAYYETHVHGDGSEDPLLVEGIYTQGGVVPASPQPRDGYILFSYPDPHPAQLGYLRRFSFPYERLGFEILGHEMIVVDGMTYTRVSARKPRG